MPCPTEAERQNQLWPLLLGAVPSTLHTHPPILALEPGPQHRRWGRQLGPCLWWQVPREGKKGGHHVRGPHSRRGRQRAG